MYMKEKLISEYAHELGFPCVVKQGSIVVYTLLKIIIDYSFIVRAH